ncbi:hypothetical protein [Streptomyces iconiensis]|uniref:Uncharacterized protein n=1 Tax=Streptomyces iconiensis TaxID=1384038 RepID=A0ABT6ZSE0_9ACTN|nr:hypothetical protein [Streptomyces iconiensis]MDJ1131989.1 hypothetical protein [Streptomyces iconiensis]
MTFAIPRAGPQGAESAGPAGVADVLEVPARAGRALLRRRGLRTGPVAYDPVRERVLLLVPSGSAEELPGLLEWLEWGGVELELTARSAYDPREAAALWLRPPESGCEPGAPVPGVDLVRLVGAAATECHRARLGIRPSQPLAFS